MDMLAAKYTERLPENSLRNPLGYPVFITTSITIHKNYCGDDIILQSWFIAKKLQQNCITF